MVKVLGLGDNVCDVYLHTNTMYPGGQAVNFAVYASELGAESDFMGVFGKDAVADMYRKHWMSTESDTATVGAMKARTALQE